MTIELRADHTHLFPGASLQLSALVPPTPVGPARAHLILSDGVEVDAELVEEVDPEPGDPDPRDGVAAEANSLILEMPGFRTAAGTEIGPRLWSISRIELSDDGASLVVGQPR